jgi:hypothetical protein
MFKTSGGLFSKGLLKGASWSGFLTTAGKTLNVINQAIPVFYQVRPIIHNARTMFRVLGAVKTPDKKQNVSPPVQTESVVNRNQVNSNKEALETNSVLDKQPVVNDNGPTFFL